MTPEYIVEPAANSRTWYGALRFNWQVRHLNTNIILHSGQRHSRRIDRNAVAKRFYDRACVPAVVELAPAEEWEA
jgi:hypothetical protein